MGFGIFNPLIGSGSSLPEHMAEEHKFPPIQDSLAHGIAPILANSKNHTSAGLSGREAIAALNPRSFREFRPAIKSRYLSTDGIG